MTMPPLPFVEPYGQMALKRLLEDHAAAVRAATIEECAKVCDELHDKQFETWAHECAAAIRALKDGS